jgi:hypothetical protein
MLRFLCAVNKKSSRNTCHDSTAQVSDGSLTLLSFAREVSHLAPTSKKAYSAIYILVQRSSETRPEQGILRWRLCL